MAQIIGRKIATRGQRTLAEKASAYRKNAERFVNVSKKNVELIKDVELPSWVKEALSSAADLRTRDQVNLFNGLCAAFVYNCMKQGVQVVERAHNYKAPKTFRRLEKLGFKRVFTFINQNGQWENVLWASDDAFASVTPNGIDLYTSATHKALLLDDHLFQHRPWNPPTPLRPINYSILLTNMGASISPFGEATASFEPDHYPEGFVELFERMKREIASPTPDGRFFLLEGLRRTGKSYWIEALTKEVPEARFVYLPPDSIASVGRPEFQTMLLNFQENHGKGPIVLVLEDADAVLSSRDLGNLHQVATLLNATDGVLSRTLSLIVIATTNLSVEDLKLDSALMERGRLNMHVRFLPLSAERSLALLRKLVPTATNTDLCKISKISPKKSSVGLHGAENNVQDGYLLGRVIGLARDLGWKPSNKTKAKAKMRKVHMVHDPVSTDMKGDLDALRVLDANKPKPNLWLSRPPHRGPRRVHLRPFVDRPTRPGLHRGPQRPGGVSLRVHADASARERSVPGLR